MKQARYVVLAVWVVALVACSKGTSVPGSIATSAQTAAPQNTTNFPLYHDSDVVASKQFSQTVNAGQASAGIMAKGSGTYTGNEVVAGSEATLSDLETWLRAQEKQPPTGYVAVALPANLASVHAVAVKNGMDFALFRDPKNNNHGVVVMAMDPAVANHKLGPALMLVSKYQALPQAMRNTVDSQLKQRYGYTASEFVEPGSPLGSAIGAMNDFQNKNERAIIIIDATKQ